MPFNVGPLELVIVLVIALLILGPGRLPEVGSALGKSIREFRKAATDVQDATKIDTPTKKAETPAANEAPAQVGSGSQPAEAKAPTGDAPEATAPTGDAAEAKASTGDAPEAGGATQPNELSESPAPNELSQPRT